MKCYFSCRKRVRVEKPHDGRSQDPRGSRDEAVVSLVNKQQITAADAGLEQSARLPGDDPVLSAVSDQCRHADRGQPRAEIDRLDVSKAVDQMVRVEPQRLVQVLRYLRRGAAFRMHQGEKSSQRFVPVSVKPENHGAHRDRLHLVVVRGRRTEQAQELMSTNRRTSSGK